MRNNLAAIIAAIFASGCGGVGACVGAGGIVDVCKEDWTREECDEWDAEGVNGSSWSWQAGSCESAGFSAQCEDGTWVYSSSDC